MAIATTDKRLYEGIQAALEQIRSLSLSGEAAKVRAIVVTQLEGELTRFGAAIQKEDSEEVDALEARQTLHGKRDDIDEAFTRLYLGLHSGVLTRRLAGDTGPDVQDLTHYLEAQSPSGFRVLGLDLSVTTLQRAIGFGERFLPVDVRDEVIAFATNALTEVKAAREQLRRESTEATQALADLEVARGAASESYLAARDLMSGALRLAKQHGKLSAVLPGLRQVLDGPAGSGTKTPVPPVSPATPEPVDG